MVDRPLVKGKRCLTPKSTWAKFGRRRSWGWEQVRNNPSFPKPIYLQPKSPVFIEDEIDAYIEVLAKSRRTMTGRQP